MASVLKISDGTTTVDFLNDAAYRVVRWSPAVAARRQGEIGRGPYEEVIEEMELFIGGATAAVKLATLRQLMDQAERWGRGENATVVYIHYKLASASTEVTAPIFGPPAPGEPAIILPERYDDNPATQAIDPVVLRFRRLGIWLAASDSAASSSVTHPTTATILLTGTAYADSPYRLSIAGMPWNEEVIWNSFILATNADTTANAAKKLVIVEAETMAAGIGEPSSDSDSANKARGNNILNFNFGSAGTIEGTAEDISASTHPDVRRWAVFVSCRNNSAVDFRVGMYGASGGRYAFTGWKTVEANANDNDPFWMHVGWISLRQQLKFIYLAVEADSPGSIDFDAVALLASDDPVYDRAVAILADETATTGTTLTGSRVLSVYHALDYDIRPYVYIIQGSDLLSQDYSGDPALFVRADRPALAVAWLACGRWNTAYWRATDSSGNVLASAFTAERMKASLVVV